MLTLFDRLKKQFPDTSHRTLKQWVEHKRVFVNGSCVSKLTTLIDMNHPLTIHKKETLYNNIPILYEDRDFMVIAKPPFLLSVPTDQQDSTSALSLLQERYRLPIYPLHRLDREASGLLLFAKNTQAHTAGKQLFADKTISRHYVAICEGHLYSKEGCWTKPLSEQLNYDVIYDPQGTPAVTYFQVYRTSQLFSFLYITLDTGKKHQIRVHCQEAGHPICGDDRYGSTCSPLKRLCLHAVRLRFTHPFTHRLIDLHSPLPPSFQRLGAHLGLAELLQKKD